MKQLLCRRAFLTTVFAALTTTVVHAAPLVGAIRWDAWYGADGPVTAMEKSLGPSKYHFRLPWFATVTGEGALKIDGDRPEIMARLSTLMAVGPSALAKACRLW